MRFGEHRADRNPRLLGFGVTVRCCYAGCVVGMEKLWAAYRSGASHSEFAEAGTTPDELFYVGLVALAKGDRDTGLAQIRAAARQEPDRLVFGECAYYLAQLVDAKVADTTDVYFSPQAFSAFGRGGGNVELYQRTHQALRERYQSWQPASLLDVGTGEGLGVLPALTEHVGRIDVLEPSSPRLAVVRRVLAERGLTYRAINQTIAEFIAAAEQKPDSLDRWDLVQETFAMLSIPAPERIFALRWLRERTRRLVLVEFDIPLAEHALHPKWFDYVVSRYEVGMGEYPGAYNLVRQGFLVPVLLGTLRPGADKVHYEQTIHDWVHDLSVAGFSVPTDPEWVTGFWWGNAYLIEAE